MTCSDHYFDFFFHNRMMRTVIMCLYNSTCAIGKARAAIATDVAAVLPVNFSMTLSTSKWMICCADAMFPAVQTLVTSNGRGLWSDN